MEMGLFLLYASEFECYYRQENLSRSLKQVKSKKKIYIYIYISL